MSEDLHPSPEEDHSAVKAILVVEDDEAIGTFVVEALLQETPYQALLATSGAEALRIVQSLKPNLVLLDYRLPDMNGLEIYNHLREMKGFENIPAILMSANMPKNVAQQRDILSLKKPFELSELLENVSTLLTERCDA